MRFQVTSILIQIITLFLLTTDKTRNGPQFGRRTMRVSGTTAGIERATARQLAAEGTHVIVTDIDGQGGVVVVVRAYVGLIVDDVRSAKR